MKNHYSNRMRGLLHIPDMLLICGAKHEVINNPEVNDLEQASKRRKRFWLCGG